LSPRPKTIVEIRQTMLLLHIVRTSQRVAATRSRLAKVDHLAECLKALAPEEREAGVCYLSGLLPQGRIGIGGAALRAAMPGTAASAPRLGIAEVDETLSRIARISGPGSAAQRLQLLESLLAQGTREEQDFLVRLLVGELRQGALEGLMVEAVAQAAQVPAQEVRRAAMVAGDLTAVAAAALTAGTEGLRRFSIRLLEPLRPMLAQTAQGLPDALAHLERAAVEFKLDGARVQVHKAGRQVRVFSRRMNDVTAAVPEVVESVRALPARELILDGEALALRPDGRPQPFQVTMRRFGRRLEVERMREALPLSVYFFDCLYLDGDDLTGEPAARRFRALSESAPEGLVIPRIETADAARAAAFLDEALGRGHEGVMAKSLEALYEAGNRGSTWLKVKPAHTLDLVVLAAEWGHGRRRGWLSNLHLGARDPATGAFVMLGKTFKGLTDDMLQWQTERLLGLEVARDDYTVYVRPELVVEVAFNDIQESPHYPAGMALRFARVKRYRPDKSAAEVDTVETVRSIHRGEAVRRG
jgi:DNA ligase-1